MVGPRGRPGRDRPPPRRGWTITEGWEDSAVAPERVGAYLRDFRGLDRMATTPLYTGTSARAASTAASTSTCAARRARRLRGFMDEAADLVVEHGGSLSGERGDGQPRRTPHKMYGPELRAGLPRVQGDLGPDWQDEPRQGRRALSHRREPAARRSLSTRLGSSTDFQYPDDDGGFSPRRRCDAWASASAAARPRGQCARATWRRAKRSTPPAAAPGSCSRCWGASRSSDGWRNDRVQRGARPLPGLQGLQGRLPGERRHGHLQGGVPLPLLRAAGCARGHAYAMGLIDRRRAARRRWLRDWPTR